MRGAQLGARPFTRRPPIDRPAHTARLASAEGGDAGGAADDPVDVRRATAVASVIGRPRRAGRRSRGRSCARCSGTPPSSRSSRQRPRRRDRRPRRCRLHVVVDVAATYVSKSVRVSAAALAVEAADRHHRLAAGGGARARRRSASPRWRRPTGSASRRARAPGRARSRWCPGAGVLLRRLRPPETAPTAPGAPLSRRARETPEPPRRRLLAGTARGRGRGAPSPAGRQRHGPPPNRGAVLGPAEGTIPVCAVAIVLARRTRAGRRASRRRSRASARSRRAAPACRRAASEQSRGPRVTPPRARSTGRSQGSQHGVRVEQRVAPTPPCRPTATAASARARKRSRCSHSIAAPIATQRRDGRRERDRVVGVDDALD